MLFRLYAFSASVKWNESISLMPVSTVVDLEENFGKQFLKNDEGAGRCVQPRRMGGRKERYCEIGDQGAGRRVQPRGSGVKETEKR